MVCSFSCGVPQWFVCMLKEEFACRIGHCTADKKAKNALKHRFDT
jgi:hypothetical protein